MNEGRLHVGPSPPRESLRRKVRMPLQHGSVNQGGLPGLTAEVGVGYHLADWPEGRGAL